jgi:hypothetical protein
MGHDPLFDALLVLAWLWLGMLGWRAWRQGRPAPLQTTPTSAKPLKKRAKAPPPFAGLTHKPLCETCGQTAEPRPPPLSAPPPRLTFLRGRRRTVDTGV